MAEKRLMVLMALSVLLTGCGQSPVPRNELVVGVPSNPLTLDPRMATDVVSARISQLIFSSLVKKDLSSNLVPDLAESWEMPDARTYLFHLRHDAVFHDGSQVTADDVVYTYQSLMSPEFNSPKRAAYEMVDSVAAADRFTVRFNLREPFSPFLVNAVMGIVPRLHGERAGEDFGRDPVGSGPFVFLSWEHEEQVRLGAADGYFAGRPVLDALTFKIVPDDNIRVFELEKGGINFVQNDIPATALARFEDTGKWRVMKAPGTNYQYIGFNMRANGPVADQTVRRAIAHAIDRDAIIEHVLGGLAVKARSLLPAEHWAYRRVVDYEYSTAKAEALLDEAGYHPDGDGFRFAVTFKCSQNKRTKRLAEVFQQQLAAVGIKLDVRSYEWATFYEDVLQGNFEMYSLSWVGITDPDIYYSIFHSSMVPPDGRNRGRFSHQRLDHLLEMTRRTFDRAEAIELYGEAQEILALELPYISLWHQTNVAVMPAALSGFELFPAGDLDSLAQVHFL
ncbi:ABC transporter substrate-binding protein [bacterium]|nr:ABC transporter substrate-binding protein [candidate division CSSED10-310 bacterium]